MYKITETELKEIKTNLEELREFLVKSHSYHYTPISFVLKDKRMKKAKEIIESLEENYNIK